MQTIEHNGIIYRNILLEDQDYEGVLSTASERHILKGKFKITAISGSWKFGDQVQFIIEAPKGVGYRHEIRNPATMDRFEVCVDLKHLDHIITALQQIKKVIQNESNKNGSTKKS